MIFSTDFYPDYLIVQETATSRPQLYRVEKSFGIDDVQRWYADIPVSSVKDMLQHLERNSYISKVYSNNSILEEHV